MAERPVKMNAILVVVAETAEIVVIAMIVLTITIAVVRDVVEMAMAAVVLAVVVEVAMLVVVGAVVVVWAVVEAVEAVEKEVVVMVVVAATDLATTTPMTITKRWNCGTIASPKVQRNHNNRHKTMPGETGITKNMSGLSRIARYLQRATCPIKRQPVYSAVVWPVVVIIHFLPEAMNYRRHRDSNTI